MASGILGQSNPTANTNTTVYTVPAGVTASFSLNICNASSLAVTVTLAVSATGTPAASEYILFNQTLQPNSALERSGIVAGAAKNVVINTTGSSVAVSVYGYEG
jgi:hypothetical protein